MNNFNGQYAEALASLVSQLGQFGGNADLTNIPMQTASDGTPITPVTTYGGIGGGNVGNFVNPGNMTQEQLNTYAQQVMGGQPDYRNLLVGSIGKGEQVGQTPNGTPINNTIDTNKLYELMNAYNALKQQGNF